MTTKSYREKLQERRIDNERLLHAVQLEHEIDSIITEVLQSSMTDTLRIDYLRAMKSITCNSTTIHDLDCIINTLATKIKG
jgi:hypothetical protein